MDPNEKSPGTIYEVMIVKLKMKFSYMVTKNG